MTATTQNLQLDLGPGQGPVSALLLRPAGAWLLYALAHGAGAGMRHRFLGSISEALASRGVATLRYQFPYMERGGRRPDTPAVAEATVQAAAREGLNAAPDLPLIAGGKSFGGRMTSGAAAKSLPGVRGLAFLGFPLHPPGQPGTSRADHLAHIGIPMLLLQGTRDQFARVDLITSVCGRLGNRATLHLVEDADHSFGVPRRSGRTPESVIEELADTLVKWARSHVTGRAI
ncbi:MAG TPA: alpha/beta family hydrolase [Gemmatimonadales bacterium]|nr:alpha/beta family hydrolase [Gemmatimonadales bacterium]